jgi:hypothetical protein
MSQKDTFEWAKNSISFRFGFLVSWCWRHSLRPFAWRFQFDRDAYRYFQNEMTGDRKAKWVGSGYSPVDTDWLRGAPSRSAWFIAPFVGRVDLISGGVDV